MSTTIHNWHSLTLGYSTHIHLHTLLPLHLLAIPPHQASISYPTLYFLHFILLPPFPHPTPHHSVGHKLVMHGQSWLALIFKITRKFINCQGGGIFVDWNSPIVDHMQFLGAVVEMLCSSYLQFLTCKPVQLAYSIHTREWNVISH